MYSTAKRKNHEDTHPFLHVCIQGYEDYPDVRENPLDVDEKL